MCGGETWKRNTVAFCTVSAPLLFWFCAVKCHFVFQIKLLPADYYVHLRIILCLITEKDFKKGGTHGTQWQR